LTAVWNEARPVFVDAFHGDTYEVLRGVTLVSDGSGGNTAEPIVVDGPRRCSLTVSNRLGGERVSGNTVISVSIYVAELPINANVTETDTLRINGNRTFEITDVKTGGLHDLFTEVTLEERT
ncbi:MAG: hypothetical protein M3451_13635, partial [Chloroflexota bacterium]|nr:hypothetical protein [Chloroflexota bacterium]